MADPQPQSQPRYVQMPDNTYVEWPEGVSPEDFKAKVAGKYGNTVPEKPTALGIRPHQSDTVSHAVEDVLGNIGGGGLEGLNTIGRLSPWGAAADKLMGKPTIYGETYDSLFKPNPPEPNQVAKSTLLNLAQHPMEAVEGAIGGAAATGPLFEAAAPSTARAAGVLSDIENQAKNVPVTLTNTKPASGLFKNYIDTGGMPSRVMRKLAPRVEQATAPQPAPLGAPQMNPINVPEARDFYTKLSRSSARPNTLKRLLESPEKPEQRMQLGNVRQAFGDDITDAIEQGIGRGQEYQNAIKEYGSAARANKLVKRLGYGVGAYAGSKALQNMGLLGDVARKVPGGE